MVPISMWMQDLITATEIGNAVAQTSKQLDRDVVIVASTDFTHYKPHDIAYNNDHQVLDAIKALDEKAVMNRVEELNVTMCGFGPVNAAIIYSKQMGAEEVEVLKYATSGDITGDKSAVVGYAAAVIK